MPQLENSNFQGLIDVLHYLAFSLDQHDAIDVVAIVIQQRLEEGVDASVGQLAAISECFIAAPLALNPLRHQALIHAIRHRVCLGVSLTNHCRQTNQRAIRRSLRTYLINSASLIP